MKNAPKIHYVYTFSSAKVILQISVTLFFKKTSLSKFFLGCLAAVILS